MTFSDALQLDVLHEDHDIIVVNKPSGLLSVPGRGADMQDSVVRRLQEYRSDCLLKHPEVHRLDMDTSGLLVVTFYRDAHRELSRQFEHREVEKRYLALLEGKVSGKEGLISLPFCRDYPNRPRQMFDVKHGKTGVTLWKKLGEEDGCTRIEFRPRTGRTHQLRLHASHPLGLNTPIVGDRLYGNGTAPGQLKLHACFLAFTHPVTGERLTFSNQSW